MTRLELWDRDVPRIRSMIGGSIDFKDIRRALAVAQAVDARHADHEFYAEDVIDGIIAEADELLKDKP